jgi:hypothetical protein
VRRRLHLLYSFDPTAHVRLEEFTDIGGRKFRQPKEGLGFAGSPTAHLWLLAREEKGHAGALRHSAELVHQVVGDRHAVLEPLAACCHLRVPGHEHGLGGIGRLRVVEHVDDLVEILFE